MKRSFVEANEQEGIKMQPNHFKTGSRLEHGTILYEFRQQVAKWGNKPAIIYANETKSVTYLELQNKSRGLAQQLKSETNPIIALLLPCGFEHILSVFSVLEASKTYCPLSVDYPPVKLTLMLQELGNPLVITTTAILKSVGLEYENTFFLDTLEHQGLEMTDTRYEIPNEAETAAVYFTSGSTGVPKAALLSSKAIADFTKIKALTLKLDSTDVSVGILNPGFILNICDVFMLLLSGGTIHIAPNHLRYDIPKLREWVKSIGTVTFVMMVSSTGETFFQAEPEAFPPSLRTLVVAGEKLQTGPRPDTPFKVYSCYGSTETTAITMIEVSPVAQPLRRNSVIHTPAGIPFPKVEVYILDEETLKPLPFGETGEIAVASPRLSQGYLNRPEETANKFVVLENGIRVCRMGDLGYLQLGGLVILNRCDNQIKVSGYRFDLSDLEVALLQHSSVKKAVAVMEKLDTLKLHLFYQLKSNAVGRSAADLKINEFLHHRLPHYAFPHTITEVEDFPRNPHGKVDKRALLIQKTVELEQKTVECVTTPTENMLAKIWAETLGISISKISRNDNFFSLGGNSNKVATVISKLKEINSDLQLEPFNIFRVPVLVNLAEFLDKSIIGRVSLNDANDLDDEVKSVTLDFVNLDNLEKSECVKHILITGSTGYLGGRLLRRLLQMTEADIHCLIRANNKAEARRRQEKSFKKLNMLLDDTFYPRLHFIPGNISMPFLGLSEAQFSDLAGVIDQVYHCAAEVHWFKRYEELRAPNVLGTLEILKFVCLKKVKILHYISTVGVLGLSNGKTATQLETREIAPNVRHEMGYTQSKWVAEKLVWTAIDAGVPAIIYRPGIIGPDSRLRSFNTNDFITLLLQACRAVGAYPNFPWEFPYSTVDFTVNAIIDISQNPEMNCSKVFHTFQNALSFADFYEYFEKLGMKKMSIGEWENLIQTTGMNGESVALEMIKLFLSIPYYKDLTFFQLPFSQLKTNISNVETMKALSTRTLLSKEEQITNFAYSVLRKSSLSVPTIRFKKS